MTEATGIAERVAKFGWIAKGIIFAIIGLLALELARGGYRGEKTDQTGALAALSDAPFGRVLVLLVGVGLLLFAGWQWWSAAVEPADSVLDVLKRIGYFGLGVVYGLLALTALTIALQGTEPSRSGDGPTSPDGLAEWILDLPGGRVLVAIIAIVTICVGLYHLKKGWQGEFLDDIDTRGLSSGQSTGLRVLGVAGFTARALMLGVAGGLMMSAAWNYAPDDAAGLDQSLRTLVEAPAGRILLAAAALGLFAAGVYDALTFDRQELGDD